MENRISTPTRTRAIMETYGFSLKKKYGQNFLTDEHILDDIVSGADIQPTDWVIEIGPGIGALTQYLAEKAEKVIAIEIDDFLIPILGDTLSGYSNIDIVHQDVLKVDFEALLQDKKPSQHVKVVANLPYYITTPIIMKIFEEHVPVTSITVMVQKEVADRMDAKPSTKDYGSLTLAVQFYADTEIVVQVPPSCFIPQPKVGSSVIKLTRKTTYTDQIEDDKALFNIIRGAFQQRRKTLVNTLSHQSNNNYTKEHIRLALEKIGLSSTIRGEALSLDEFIELTNALQDVIEM